MKYSEFQQTKTEPTMCSDSDTTDIFRSGKSLLNISALESCLLMSGDQVEHKTKRRTTNTETVSATHCETNCGTDSTTKTNTAIFDATQSTAQMKAISNKATTTNQARKEFDKSMKMNGMKPMT